MELLQNFALQLILQSQFKKKKKIEKIVLLLDFTIG